MSAILASGLVPARWSAGGNTNMLRIFLIEVILLSCFMMASHRWSHTQKEHLSPLVVWLQENGALVSHLHHSLHYCTTWTTTATSPSSPAGATRA